MRGFFAALLRRLQDDARLADIAETVLRVLVEAALQQAAYGRRGLRREVVEVGRARHHRGEHVRHALAAEGRPSREHLQQNDAERPDVGTAVDRLPPGLLGRHVGRGPEDDAGPRGLVRERRRLRVVALLLLGIAREGLGQTEVQELHLAVWCHRHVRGFEVAVDDPLLVRVLERFCHLASDRQRLADRDRPLLETFEERRALSHLHDQGPRPARILDAVDGGDVGVVERGQESSLTLEAGHSPRTRSHVVGQHLERDLAPQARVSRPVHLSHPALAERANDFVAPKTRAGRQHPEDRLSLNGTHQMLGEATGPVNAVGHQQGPRLGHGAPGTRRSPARGDARLGRWPLQEEAAPSLARFARTG